jgi:radical SAM superfamily enzyme YgiQ (UPF0313 family)
MEEKLLLFDLGRGKMPTLGLGYIASYLRKYLNYNHVAIEITDRDQLEVIKKHKPDVVGFTAVTRNYNRIVRLAKRVKDELEIPTIIGGSHITYLPHTLPKEFDIGVIGEGEETMMELMDVFLREKEFDSHSLEKINGIAFHDGNQVKITSERRLIFPLDKIPFPARDLFDMKSYLQSCGMISYSRPDRLVPIITSRGCPYRCTFCVAPRMYKYVRFHSPAYVVNEIKSLIDEYDVKVIHISDDLFTTNKKRLREIVRLINREKINEKVGFWLNTRANELNEEVCKLLKKMNTIHVMMGFESGSQRILSFLKKNTVTVEQNRNSILLAKKYGFTVEGAFMIGAPGETKEDMMQTYKFIEDHPLDSFYASITTPLPGTELWELAKKEGKVSDDMNFDDLYTFNPRDFLKDYEKYVVLTDEVSKREFVEIFLKFYKLYMKRGRYAKIKPHDIFSVALWRRTIYNPRETIRFIKDKLATLW